MAQLYFDRSAFVDLIDNQGNTQDGIHIASAGGTWQALVCGFGGFRVRQGKMTFKPWLPEGWSEIRFAVKWRGAKVSVVISHEDCRFLMTGAEGRSEEIFVFGRPVVLQPGIEASVSRAGEPVSA